MFKFMKTLLNKQPFQYAKFNLVELDDSRKEELTEFSEKARLMLRETFKNDDIDFDPASLTFADEFISLMKDEARPEEETVMFGALIGAFYARVVFDCYKEFRPEWTLFEDGAGIAMTSQSNQIVGVMPLKTAIRQIAVNDDGCLATELMELGKTLRNEHSHACAPEQMDANIQRSMNSASEGDMPAAAPEQALWHAQLIVVAMKENEGITLDYSPDSVRHLDGLLRMFHKNGLTVERTPKILFQTGCYVGQVVVNACPELKWMHPKDCDPPLDTTDFPHPVIIYPNHSIWSPIASAVKVLSDPENNSLHATCLIAMG